LTPNRKLKSVYGFNEPDLEANRNGQLTARQVQQLRAIHGQNQVGAAVLFVLSLGCLLLSCYQLLRFFVNPAVGNFPLWFILAGLSLFGVIIVPIRSRRNNNTLNQDLDEGRIQYTAGVGFREKRVVRTRYGNQTYFYVRVGDFNMGMVNEDIYDAYLNAHCYRVYYLPRSRHIVSVEMIDCMEMSAPPPQTKAKNTPEAEIPLNKETSFLVYTLRGEGTYDAAIKWYVAKDKPAKVAWQKQSDDVTTLNQEALQRLPKVQREMQNQGWEFTNEKDDGEIANKATFRRVYTMERVRVENEIGYDAG
jgi:hypothetical protein